MLRTVTARQLNTERFLSISIIVITLIGLLLRLFRLGAHSFWLDEADSVKVVRVILGIDPSGNWGVQLSRPLYYLMLTPFYLFSQSEWSLSLVSVLSGVLAIPLVYFFGAKVWSRKIGLVAALLLAFSPFHIYYSQELRSYSLLMVLSILGFYFSFRVLEEHRNVDYLGMIVSFLTGIYTHIYIMFPLIIVNLYYLFGFKKNRPYFRKWCLSNFLIIILGAPIFYLSMYYSTHRNIQLADFPPGFRSLVSTFYLFTMGRVFFPTRANLVVILFQLAICGTGLVLGVWRLWKERTRQWGASAFSFVIASAVTYVAIWIFSMICFPLFDEARVNYLIFLLPIYLLIVVLGWDSLSNSTIKYTLIGAAVFFSLVSNYPFYFEWDLVGKGNFRAAASYIDQNHKTGEVVYHVRNTSTSPIDYYLNWRVPQIDLSLPGSDKRFTEDRFWLVVFRQQGGADFSLRLFEQQDNTSDSQEGTTKVCADAVSDPNFDIVEFRVFPGKNELTVCLCRKRGL